MTNEKLKDDYEWQNQYPNDHAWQTQYLEKNLNLCFEIPPYFSVDNGKINIYNGKMHENHILLYETILKINPLNVFEVGFGYGNHLYSLKKLLPQLNINGCEISYKQKFMALNRYPLLQNVEQNLLLGDFLLLSIPNSVFDIVYSQAVLMHMSTQRAKQAIEKMCNISTKYVMSIDGGLILPDYETFLPQFGKVTYLKDFADKYWDSYVIPPFIIEVKK